MTAASELILNFLVNALWQIPAICGLAALGTYLLRNCSAQYRYTVWIASLFFCLIAPFVTATKAVQPLTMNFASREITTQQIIQNGADDQVAPDHTQRRSSQVVVNATPRNTQLISAAYLLFLVFGAIRFVRLWITKERLRRSVSFEGLSVSIEIAMK